MRDDESAAYKTVRGLSRGLLLLKLLNKFDGGATPGLLAEFSGLHRTTRAPAAGDATGGGFCPPQPLR